PIVEALACGAPVVGADNSSIRELLPADLRFDGYDPAAIAAAVHRALTDEDYRKLALSRAAEPPPTWDAVADATAGAYERVAAGLAAGGGLRPGWPRRRHVAMVLPDDANGRDDGTAVAVALGAVVDVDVFVRREPPDGLRLGPIAPGVEIVGRSRLLRRLAPWRGGYDGAAVWLDGADPVDAWVHAERTVVISSADAADLPVGVSTLRPPGDEMGPSLPADPDAAAAALLAALDLHPASSA
ncbi:MAG TPA: hypothetical protein VKV25_08795, partial [Acidimicrobiales bacterium]|nr:hypothetical protein [Acidimicrobiales bacterium]